VQADVEFSRNLGSGVRNQMSNVEPEVLEAAGFATRYELDTAGGTIIVELVDDATDEWVVRTARSANLFAEKELVRGRANALRRAMVLRAK
jgi:hypothetical protein